MAGENIVERLDKLEEENKKLRLEVERAQAVNEIRNILGKLQAYHTAGMDEKITTLFAKRPDSRVYFGELGSFDGPDCAERAGATMPGGPRAGHMPIHLMCNPVIEVAADGQTAQAVFVAAGIVAMKDSKTGRPTCMWEWNRYGEDFIKEEGKWKLWHHHVYPLFQIGWDENWTEHFSKKKEGHGMQLPFKPDNPPTPLDVFYSPDEILPLIPVPEPYDTWDPERMY